MAGKTKTYLVERSNEVLKVTVPEDWKVTFGPNTYGKGGWGGSDSNMLRFYETKEKQRAVFTNVRSFRDMDIPVQKKVKETKTKHVAEKGNGVEKVEQETKITQEWLEAEEVVF